MIRIVNPSGRALDLFANTTIPVERNLPLISDNDKLVQDVSYQSKAPLTENNKIFIQNGHLVETKNSFYELTDIRVYDEGESFYSGNLRYKIADGQIQFTLKVNLGAVAAYMKTVKLSEAYFVDAETPITSTPAIEAYMKQTALNPLSYPAVHFPVFNPAWHEVEEGPLWNNVMNSWDIETEQFDSGDFTENNIIVPFFRLTYIIKQVFKILGFEAEGSFFESDYYNRLCLFTRVPGLGNKSKPSNGYMPDMFIGDFLKQVRERLKLNYDVDLMAKKVYIESATDILSSRFYHDIRPYVNRIKEIDSPDKKGYSVTLKVDESDPAMNLGTSEVPNFNPEYTLNIGDGETQVNLDIGTLRATIQEAGYSFPLCQQRMRTDLSVELTSWQLRLLYYKGMYDVPGGGTFPEAEPVELTLADADFYRFLNDGKPVKIQASIPPGLLSKMRPHHKILFRSAEGNEILAIPTQISFNHTNNRTELIETIIEAKTVAISADTAVTIQKTPDILAQKGTMTYKVYFDPERDFITEFKLMRYVDSEETFDSTTIKVPTDKNGVGGDIGFMYQTNAGDGYYSGTEFRVYGLTPSSLVYQGRKYPFLSGPGYVYVIPVASTGYDPSPVWVIF
ncbi:hypothetical protein [Pedobacter ginsengisoli]|uniref:hypothetical protein n=1 Tax=Pedobacter ginsengisoli TaxID=363852 RepID=UPI0025502DEC|nr:hypothetical protein [Pedobacter ginsengisoli]